MFILVLGSNGMLGREITKQLSMNGIPHISCGRNQVNITSEIDIHRALKSNNVTHVINCAAYTNVPKAEIEMGESKLVNCDAIKYLVDACNKYSASLIHFSTDYVFDGCKVGSYNESDEVHAVNWYGQTKLEGEKYITNDSEDYAIFRLQWLYGKSSNSFIYKIMDRFLDNGQIQVVDDQFGSPCSVSFVAKTVIEALGRWDLKENGIYHLTHDDHCSWYQFAKYIFELFSKESFVTPIKSDSFRDSVVRPDNCVMSNSKIINQFRLESLGGWKSDVNNFISHNMGDFSELNKLSDRRAFV